jgi:hypothetical protein
MNKQDWSGALRNFIKEQRLHSPIPNRDALSDEEEWHCRIIGGGFRAWYQNRLRQILLERSILTIAGFDPDPLIVFTAPLAGLVVAQEVMPETPENLVYLGHQEFKEWEREHLVDAHTFHIHHWSYFTGAEGEMLEAIQQTFPTVSVDQIRIHVSGDLWGEQCGIEIYHVWQWNGEKMILLEEAFSHVVF